MQSVKPLFLLFFSATFVSLSIIGCSKGNSPAPVVTITDTLVLQPGPNEGEDAFVSHADNTTDGDIQHNVTPELAMGRVDDAQQFWATYRSYLKFDSLSEIPVSATVISAQLYLYGESSSLVFPGGNSYYEGSTAIPNTSLLQQVTGGDWDQATLTWNNAPTTSATGEDTIPASTTAFDYNVQVDVTGLVKGMVSSPSTNYGFCIRVENDTTDVTQELLFSTSESSDATLRPMLVIQYSYIK